MVTVYTQNLCGYCSYAKMYLERMDIPFEEINIDENKQAREFLREQGHRTTPQIYHNNKYHSGLPNIIYCIFCVMKKSCFNVVLYRLFDD